jgi:hypothetical protein
LSLRLWRRGSSLSLCLLHRLLLLRRFRGLCLPNYSRWPARILSILVASRRFTSLRVNLLFASCVGLLSYFAIPLVFELQLLTLSRVRNWFRAQRLRQVLSKWRRNWLGADDDVSLVKFLGNARRQINLAATPGGI